MREYLNVLLFDSKRCIVYGLLGQMVPNILFIDAIQSFSTFKFDFLYNICISETRTVLNLGLTRAN